MKSFAFISSVFAALAAAGPLEQRAAAGCIADNCLRALTVTDSNLKTARPVLAKSDCSVYAQATSTVTVTPAVSTLYLTSTTVTSTATTVYTTGTSTVTVVIPTTLVIQSFVKRDVAFPAINPNDPAGLFHDTSLARRALTVPAYASACTSVARFASACSCAFGILPTTATVSVTLPALSTTIYPVVTSTAVSTETDTLTHTVSTTTTAVVATSTVYSAFKIRASGSPVDGQYLTDGVLYPGINIPFWSTSPPALTTCTLNPADRNLVCDGQIVHIIGTGQFFQIRDYDDAHKLQCQIDPITRQLTCDPIVSPDIPHPTSQWYTCIHNTGSGNQQYLQQGINAISGCVPITVYAEPI